MKRKKIASMIGALVLIISATTVITGCPPANGTSISTKNIIEFDAANIKCTNLVFNTINNGDPIQEKDKLLFEAILPSGKIVENWHINDVKYATNSTIFYIVKASDIVGGKLKISFTTKVPVKGNIEFDAARVKCQNINSSPYTDINNGDPIQEKDRLLFEAVLPSGKFVENWYINDVKKYETNSAMRYTVKASDIMDGKIKISAVFK